MTVSGSHIYYIILLLCYSLSTYKVCWKRACLLHQQLPRPSRVYCLDCILFSCARSRLVLYSDVLYGHVAWEHWAMPLLYVSVLCDVGTTMNSPNDTGLGTYPL